MDDIDDTEVIFLTVDEVIVLHTEAIRRYARGESLAILDMGRLEAAVMQPQQTFGGEYLYHSLFEMAAAYLIGLAFNHPFENGNKRVAFGACSIFLKMNGFRLTMSEQEATDTTLRLLKHELSRDHLIAILHQFTESN